MGALTCYAPLFIVLAAVVNVVFKSELIGRHGSRKLDAMKFKRFPPKKFSSKKYESLFKIENSNFVTYAFNSITLTNTMNTIERLLRPYPSPSLVINCSPSKLSLLKIHQLILSAPDVSRLQLTYDLPTNDFPHVVRQHMWSFHICEVSSCDNFTCYLSTCELLKFRILWSSKLFEQRVHLHPPTPPPHPDPAPPTLPPHTHPSPTSVTAWTIQMAMPVERKNGHNFQ